MNSASDKSTPLSVLIINFCLFVILAATACGNPDLIRKLEPYQPKNTKIVKDNKAFLVTAPELKLQFELVTIEEINELLEESGTSYGYDIGYRFPQISVFKLIVENTGRDRLYFNPHQVFFLGDDLEAQPIYIYTEEEYRNRFESQSYSRYEYHLLFAPDAAYNRLMRSLEDDDEEYKKNHKKERHPLYSYIIEPKKKKEFLLPFPLLSQAARKYDFVVPFRKLLGTQAEEKFVIKFKYLIERES